MEGGTNDIEYGTINSFSHAFLLRGVRDGGALVR